MTDDRIDATVQSAIDQVNAIRNAELQMWIHAFEAEAKRRRFIQVSSRGLSWGYIGDHAGGPTGVVCEFESRPYHRERVRVAYAECGGVPGEAPSASVREATEREAIDRAIRLLESYEVTV